MSSKTSRRRSKVSGADERDDQKREKRAKRASSIVEGENTYTPRSPSAWREWLSKNGQKVDSVWLVIYNKKSKQQTCSYNDALNEALCYGWIDSSVRKRDGDSYYQYFTRRNPKSNWSRINKEKVEQLDKHGKMAEAGWAAVRLAKESGTWTALDDVEALKLPPDLAAAFEAADPAAQQRWAKLARSIKRGLLESLLNVKRPETRAKHIRDIVYNKGK